MFRNNSGKISASAAMVVFVIGVVAIVGAAVLLIVRPGSKKSDNGVQASVAPFAARLDRMDGDIGIARQTGTEQGEQDQQNQQNQPNQQYQQYQQYQGWSKATINAPVSRGDRIYVRDGSKAAIAINRNNYVRLNPRSSLDLVSLSEGHTQLALREGACVFDVGALASDETYEVGTPNGAVDFTQPGLYQVGVDDDGDTVVSVLSGVAQVASTAGSGEVSKGQLLTLAAAETTEAVVSDLSPDVAGGIVNDYYSYRYPSTYDGRYSDYHAYEDNPNYYRDSYRRSSSYQYIPEDAEIAGVEDLDTYGDWQDVPKYGHCWHPRATSSDWAPYRDGYWSDDHTLGLNWVSNEQWGWAPYHYGRWAHVDQKWYWVPTDIERQTPYAPALVAFVSPRADQVGWVPLGPGDAYVPRYYDQDHQTRYAGSRTDVERYVNATDVVNYRDPGAVTVVSISQFSNVITPTTISRVDPASYANTRLYGDPYAVPAVRQIAPTLESSRPVVSVPLESQQRFNQPVMMRHEPVVPPAAPNVAETLNVQRLPEAAVKQKLKVNKASQAVVATQPNGIPAPPEAKPDQQTAQEREARMNALATQAAQGNKAAKREMRQLEAQQQQDAKAQQKASEQQAAAQQEQQLEQQKAQKRAERQQAQQAAQQAEQQRQGQGAQQAEQAKAQKRAERQAAQQAAQQRQAQEAQQAEQQKAQKRAERQQAQAQQAAQQASQQRPAQAAQQSEQQKAQKRAARQQGEQAAQQAAQQQAQQAAARQQAQQEQRRIQKQAQQQAQQQAQEQARQQHQQEKQQRRAEGQNAQQGSSPANPGKAARKAEKAKNKNSNQ